MERGSVLAAIAAWLLRDELNFAETPISRKGKSFTRHNSIIKSLNKSTGINENLGSGNEKKGGREMDGCERRGDMYK